MERPPNFFEKYQIVRNVNLYYTNFNVTSRFNHYVLKLMLSQAISAVVTKNPVFVTSFYATSPLIKDPNAYVVRAIKSINFDDVVLFRQVPAFDEAALFNLDSITCPVNTSLPMWRVVVHEVAQKDGEHPIQYITALFDHSFFDGTSGANFHQDLVEELAKVSPDASYKKVIFQLQSPEVFSSDEATLVVYNSSLLEKVMALAKEVLPSWLRSLASYIYSFWDARTAYLPQFQYKPLKEGRPVTHYQLFHLDPPELKSTIQHCKANGVTLNAYLIVAALASLQETIMDKANPSPSYSTLTIIAVNGRRYIKGPEPKYGLVVGGVTVSLPKLPSTFPGMIPFMKKLNDEVVDSVSSGECTKKVSLIEMVDVNNYMKSKFGKHSRLTFDVSNLGLKKVFSGDWEAEEMYFSQSNGLACHFDISLISTPKGGLNIVFGYTDDFKDMKDELEEFRKMYYGMLKM